MQEINKSTDYELYDKFFNNRENFKFLLEVVNWFNKKYKSLIVTLLLDKIIIKDGFKDEFVKVLNEKCQSEIDMKD